MDMDDPRLIGVQARGLIASSSGLSSSVSQTDPVIAVERAKLMFGCYRRNDAADPEVYASAVAAVLTEYDPEIVRRVTDPRSGLPSQLSWLPTVKEVRDACEELDARRRRIDGMAKLERAQLEARAREAEAAKDKPTLEQLQKKYGPNWGLKETETESETLKDRRRAIMADANRRAFAAECESAGFSADSPISPSFAAIMKAKG